jgi:4a-hydroxytetrahydrobiopterin dehydratase
VAERLTDQQIQQEMTALPGWSREGDELRKQFSFADFRAAMKFVNSVADMAESANHHPDITINYNRVSLALSTHDVGGLSRLDVELAKQADAAA